MRGQYIADFYTLAVYIIPAAVVWSGLGVVLSRMSGLKTLALVVALVFTLWFGTVETLGLPVFRPGLAWQVPAQWVRGRPAIRTLIWGAVLGPGLMTRNPFVGIWLLPFLLILAPNIAVAAGMGLAIGIAHGGMRALGVLRNRRRIMASCDPLFILSAQIQWRAVDGLGLLIAGGGLLAHVLSVL